MRKSILMIAAVVMLMGCGGKKAQGESVNADSDSITNERKEPFLADVSQEEEMETARAFVEKFYNEWSGEDILDYGYVKQYVTPNLLKYLADEYDYDCEGECLATWKFFYEGGGDI